LLLLPPAFSVISFSEEILFESHGTANETTSCQYKLSTKLVQHMTDSAKLVQHMTEVLSCKNWNKTSVPVFLFS